MKKELKALRKEYENVPIPKELDMIVTKALKKDQKRKRTYLWPTSIAAAALLFITTVNDAANAMSNIPFVKEIVEVIKFNEFKEQKKTMLVFM